ncbi:MAG: glycosyltransferase [Planctomycetaceae bacterium]|jgi:glycosyltransferase involved in cell wall biosynthesis|nr:glycosyltransferase [Planctomycetaceae bacterium]
MNNPKITFIVPVYNVEKYLHECLDSVVMQTLKDIQIICINDGSTDGSTDILNNYAEKDQRITIITLPNSGLSVARNTAYSHVKGEYILFVDSDDFIDLSMAEKLYSHARLTDADIVLFGMFYCNSDTTPYKKIVPNFAQHEIITTTDQRSKLILESCGSVCDKFYRSDFLLQNNIKCPEKLLGEDQALTFLSLAASDKIAIFPEPFYYYRMVSNSLSHTYFRNKRQTDPIYVYAFLREELIKRGLFDEFSEVFSIRKLCVFYRVFRRAIYLTEKERMNLVRSHIDNNDVEHFSKNLHKFKNNEKRILSCIIENKPLSFYDKIRDQLTRLTPFTDSLKHFFRRSILPPKS